MASFASDGTITGGQTPWESLDLKEGSLHGWSFKHGFSWETMVPGPGTGLDDNLER